MSSSEGLPVNNVVGTSIDLNPRDTQAASNSASSSQNADSAAASADAAWKFSRVAQGAAGDSTAAVSDAEAAAAAAAEAAQNATIAANIYPDVAAAQAAITAGTIPLNAMFNVAVPAGATPPRFADQYQNVAGVATPTGVSYPSSESINALSGLINSDGTTSALVLLNDVSETNIGIFAPDGGLHLCGMYGAVQDQWAIKNQDAIVDNISNVTKLQSLVGTDNSSNLANFNDSTDNPFMVSRPDGGIYVPGLLGALQDQWALQNPALIQTSVSYVKEISPIVGSAVSDNLHEFRDASNDNSIVVRNDGGVWMHGLLGALQDQYAIKYGGAVQDAVSQVSSLTDRVNALSAVPTSRAFYALDKAGELQTQGITISRITRVAYTGFALNSWPQGKMKLDSQGRVYVGYNSSPAHGGPGAVPVIKWSDDNGATWSRPVYLVTGEGKARGTDWWALGVDNSDVLWGIVRSRGATNQVGDTVHNIYKSEDRGVSWVKVGPINSVTQNSAGVDYVPELYSDMAFIDGSMITGYHFASSSRVGFLKFSTSDPLGTLTNADVIEDGAYSKLIYCEPTIAIDFEKSATGVVYGGLRTQTTTNPAKLYYMNPDLTGFTMFDSPDSIQYSPMTIRRSNGKFVLLTVERFNTGVMNLWFCNPTDFYSGATSNFWKMKIGQIIKQTITGASNVGVQAMEANGEFVYMAWSNETDNTYSDTFFGVMNMVRPTSFIGYEYLERM